jgi:hypothetical protein
LWSLVYSQTGLKETMTSKMSLLQRLLVDREEVIIFHHNWAYCSCGCRFDDITEAENHLVQKHEKLAIPSNKSLQRLLGDLLARLSSLPDTSVVTPSLSINVPDLVYAVCLDEDAIGGGQLREANCYECSATCWSFKTLQDHYLRQHPGMWVCNESCQNSRLLFTMPSKHHMSQLAKNWTYRYYCPLPGCKYHVLQHSHQHENSSNTDKFFLSKTSLKQHFSKAHAFKSRTCDECQAGTS